MSVLKILALCDSPTLGSGFARVAQNLFARWHAAGAIIDVWGVGFVGWGYRRVPYVDTFLPGGGGPGESWNSPQRLELFLAQLACGGYTHVWLMQDTFMLSVDAASGQPFPARLREVCEQKKIRSMLYFPVDASLDPEWTDIINAVDVPVAYTEFGKAEAEAKGRQRGHDFTCEVLPHGVDTDTYRPLPERRTLRQSLWQQNWVGPDDFLLINVNANQRRKDVARSLEIVSGLRKAGVPAKLLMHMPESSYEGLSLEAVGRQLGLAQLEDWAHHGFYFRKGNPLLGEGELAKYYNAADLYLTTTLGEGWGLGITEALACGCPAAVPLHTACAEILARAGHMAGQRRMVGLPIEESGIVLDGDNSRVRHRTALAPAVAQIRSYYESGAWRDRPAPSEEMETWLSWDRIAGCMLRLLKRSESTTLKKPRHYYLEFGGGLGDVFNQMYHRGTYNVLRDLEPNERAKVAIISHNPFVKELFDWHPKRSQMEVLTLPYWSSAEADSENRRNFNLPPPGSNARLPEKNTTIEFHCPPEDEAFITQVGTPFVVLSAGAGLPERSLPRPVVKQIVDVLWAEGLTVVNVGRSYDRHGHLELLIDGPGIVNAVDQLSVPGTARLLQTSVGLITCHSALNMLGWWLRKPQLLLYPQSVQERHIVSKDQWAFGIDYPETLHGRFDEFNEGMISAFLTRTRQLQTRAPARPPW